MTTWTKILLVGWFFIFSTQFELPQRLEGRLFPVVSIDIDSESPYYGKTRIVGEIMLFRKCNLVSVDASLQEGTYLVPIEAKPRKNPKPLHLGVNKLDWIIDADSSANVHIEVRHKCHSLWDTVTVSK